MKDIDIKIYKYLKKIDPTKLKGSFHFLDLSLGESISNELVLLDEFCSPMFAQELRAQGNYLVFLGESKSDPTAQICQEIWKWPLSAQDFEDRLIHLFKLVKKETEVKVALEQIRTIRKKLKQDYASLERIYEKILPKKLETYQGAQIFQKYFSGLRVGAEYFDVFQFEDHRRVGFMMSDASTYQVSASFLSILLRRASSIYESTDKIRSLGESILSELRQTMIQDYEKFSFLFATYDKTTMHLDVVRIGSIYFSLNDRLFHPVTSEMTKLTNLSKDLEQYQWVLSGRDRIGFISDGAYENLGSQFFDQIPSFENLRKAGLECIYRIKGPLKEEELPSQDCSIILVEIEPQSLRLVK